LLCFAICSFDEEVEMKEEVSSDVCVSGSEGAGGSGFFVFEILDYGWHCFLWCRYLQFASIMAAAEASSKSSTVIAAVDGFRQSLFSFFFAFGQFAT